MKFIRTFACIFVFSLAIEYAGIVNAESPGTWTTANRITLKMHDESLNYSSTWNFQRGENGDFSVVLDENRAGETRAGRVLMIENQALLIKDLVITETQALPALDGPSLMLQLILKLLKKAFPEGPQSVSNEANIDLASDGTGIKVSTPTASADFASPWSVKGLAKKEGRDRISFDINFDAANRINTYQTYSVHFSGVWQYDRNGINLPGTMSLKGWQTYSIGPKTRAVGNVSVIEFGTRKRGGFANLDELRKAISKGWATEVQNQSRYQCAADFP